VGKSKCLRARLLSYFRSKSRDAKAGRIVAQAKYIIWEYAASEFAALLRELELIRRWRPRCNVHGQPLRRRLAYVCLAGSPAPYVCLRRRPSSKVLARFGPISAGLRALEAVRRLNDVFQLRDCPQPQDMIFAGDRNLFPGDLAPGCLRHEIGTCLGPCAAACSRSAYRERVGAARAFLERRDDSNLTRLEEDMAAAALALQFERAAVLRDQLESLRWLAEKLDYLNDVRARYSFVYPVRGHGGEKCWYLIHGGRTLAVLAEPQSREERQAAVKLLETIYVKESAAQTLESYEHIDGMLVVTSWFRKRPKEWQKILKPDKALRMLASVES